MIKAKYIKDNSMIILNVGMVYKYIQMVMFISENLIKIKSMVKVNFIGLVFHLQ